MLVIKERANQNTFPETGYVKEYVKLHPAQSCRQYLPSQCEGISSEETLLPEVLSYAWVS